MELMTLQTKRHHENEASVCYYGGYVHVNLTVAVLLSHISKQSNSQSPQTKNNHTHCCIMCGTDTDPGPVSI